MLRVGMSQHRDIEIRTVAPDRELVVPDPVAEFLQSSLQGLFVLVEHSLRRDPLLEPPDQSVLTDAALIGQVGLYRNGTVKTVIADLACRKVELHRSDTDDDSVRCRT